MKEAEFKKQFFEVIGLYRKHEIIVDNLSNILGNADIFEADLFEIYYKTFDRLIETWFNEEGVDWFNWWLFDKPEDCTTLIYHYLEINIDTDEKFYNFLKQFINVTIDDSHNEGC